MEIQALSFCFHLHLKRVVFSFLKSTKEGEAHATFRECVWNLYVSGDVGPEEFKETILTKLTAIQCNYTN